ncbi:MAG: HAD family phosphatase [Myxococcota bacterium]
MATGPHEAVLFDMDGVLIDSYEVWFHLMNAATVEYGIPAISRETFQSCWGQGIQADVRVFFVEQSIEELEAFYDEHFMDFGEHLRVDPDAGGVLAWLKERAIPTGVITNTPAGLASRILAHARLVPDVLVGGTDVARSKPAPDMVVRACELVRVAPDAALVVGDSSFDRDAARAAGASFAGLGIEADFDLARLVDVLRLLEAERETRAASS